MCYLHLLFQAQRFAVLRTPHIARCYRRFARCASPRYMRQFGETSLVPHRGLGWVTGRHGHLGSWLHLRSLCESHQTTPGAAAVVAAAHHTATTVGSARPCYALSMGARLPLRQGGGGSHHGQSTPLLRILHALRRPPVPTLSWRAGCCLFILPTFILCLQQAPLPIRLSAH